MNTLPNPDPGKKWITRFAPSPTGYLHLGHVVNAIYVWGIAEKWGGSVLLRMEDHDQGRFRPEYETGILEDLAWLGFQPDLNAFSDFEAGPTPFRQSDNQLAYQAALEHLKKHETVYACDCSRKEILARTQEEWGELRYDGYCQDRNVPEGKETQIRLAWSDVEEVFEDLLLGKQYHQPDAQCGDLQLLDKRGQWSYQFAVTVDDWQQGVNLVIRGEDIMSSTGRQLRLARQLGRTEMPLFLHHPLLYDESGKKLSKRQWSEGIQQARLDGIAPEIIIGQAAAGCGLINEYRPIKASEIVALF